MTLMPRSIAGTASVGSLVDIVGEAPQSVRTLRLVDGHFLSLSSESLNSMTKVNKIRYDSCTCFFAAVVLDSSLCVDEAMTGVSDSAKKSRGEGFYRFVATASYSCHSNKSRLSQFRAVDICRVVWRSYSCGVGITVGYKIELKHFWLI
jgi:hypothetical protein